MTQVPHQPVLLQAILDTLHPVPNGLYIDGTLGAGGHSSAILETSSPSGQLIGLDLDPQALEIAQNRLSIFGQRAHVIQASYTNMQKEANKLGWVSVDGILLDLGVSSMQIDTPTRGFSFIHDGPLDMRFTPVATQSAADLLNSLPEDALADIFFRYGEERKSRRIARSIVENRPIYTTTELANLVLKTIGKTEKIHPATRIFQALRIAVNKELENVERTLPIAVSLLKPGGILAVISFHSLEDRIVKDYFKHESTDCICPPRQPICTCGHKASIRLINKKPIEADDEEKRNNTRARSAKLRFAEKI